MVFLENPETTTSYQSWRDITGCCCVLVQARTGSGLKKNSTIFHRIAYSQTDLETYRIIVVDPPDTRVTFTENGPGTRDHENDEPLKNAEKYVIATASSENEILQHWEVVRRNFKIPFCGSVSAQHAAQALKNEQQQQHGEGGSSSKNVKRDAVKERRLASAILPNWANFYQSPLAKTATQQIARSQQQQQQGLAQSQQQQQQQQHQQQKQNGSSNNNNNDANKPLQPPPVTTSSPSSPSYQTPQRQQNQNQTQQQQQTPQQQQNNNTTKPRLVDTSSFSVEENPIINREFAVVKELPTIERSLAQACLRIQPNNGVFGLLYITLLASCYIYARMTQTSALFDVTVFILFLWHCRVDGSNNNNNHNNVEKALEREREVDALGGLGRLINIFSLSHPPSAVAFWVIVHFVATTYYPEVLPNGIMPLVQGMTLPCAVAALLLAPHIGPVERPASPEEFETDESPTANLMNTTSTSMNSTIGSPIVPPAAGSSSPPGASSNPLNNNVGASSSSSSPQRSLDNKQLEQQKQKQQQQQQQSNTSFTNNQSLSLSTSFGPGNASFARSPMPATTRRCLQLWKSGGQWKLSKERDGVLYRTKPVPWCNPLAIWLTTTIPNCRATDVEGVLTDDKDGSNKKSFAFQFDKMMDHRFRAAELQIEPWLEHVWCTRFKTPIFTVKPRELSTKVTPVFYLTLEQQKRWGIESDTGVVYTFCGFTDPHNTVEKTSKYERGDMHCYGMIAIENGGGVILHQILSMDLGGYLPSWVVNLTNDEQIDRVAMIRDLCVKHKGRLPLQPAPRRPASVYNADTYRSLGLDINKPEDRQLVAQKYTMIEGETIGDLMPNASSSQNNNQSQQQQQQQQQQHQQSSSSPSGGAGGGQGKHPTFDPEAPKPSAVNKALKLLNENPHEWKKIKEDDGIEYSTRPSPFCNKVAVKLHTTFDPSLHITAADVHNVLNDDPKGDRGKDSSAFKFDRLLGERICLKYVNEHLQHWRTCYKSPVWGVKARDMCTIYNTHFLDPETAAKNWGIKEAARCGGPAGEVFFIAAEDNGKNVPEDSSYNRGAVHVYFIVAVDLPNGGCDMTTVLSVDPQGYIPASLVDATNLEQIEKLKFQRELFIEESKKRRSREQQQQKQQSSAAASSSTGNNNNNNSQQQQQSGSDNNSNNQKPIADTLKKAIKLYNEVEWKDVTQKKDVTFKDGPCHYCNKKATFYKTFIPRAKIDDVAAIVDDDPNGDNPKANAYTYDRLLTKRICVKRETDSSTGLEYVTWRTLYKSPVWGVGARDFVFRTNTAVLSSKEQQQEIGFVSEIEGGRVWCFSADNRGDQHPTDSSYTRGALHTFVLMGVETKNGVDLYQISSFDPQGMIPASVIDATNAEQIEKLAIMRKLMEEHAQKSGR